MPLQRRYDLLNHDVPARRIVEGRAALGARLGARQLGETIGTTNAVTLWAHVDRAEHHLETNRALTQAFVNLACGRFLRAAASACYLIVVIVAAASGPLHGAR